MKKQSIIIIGSTNIDMVIKAPRIPVPGETILGGTFFMNSGGKGANQAVTVARLGGNAVFVSKIGNDIFGKQSLELFQKEGIYTAYMLSDNHHSSGVALITVDEKGENSIVVASGANAHLKPEDIADVTFEDLNIRIMLLQLEIPLDTVQHAVQKASEKNIIVILNPAPARTLSSTILKYVDIITPNATEATHLSGIEVKDMTTAREAALIIQKKGVKNIVITMGEQGALILDSNHLFTEMPVAKVKAVDTTAAGDVFNGALAVALSEQKDLPTAVAFACQAAAISVTRWGAQSSIPYRNELYPEV